MIPSGTNSPPAKRDFKKMIWYWNYSDSVVFFVFHFILDTCVLYIQYLCTIYTILVYYIYNTCVLYIQYLCTIYTILVYYIYNTCVRYIQYLCTIFHSRYLCTIFNNDIGLYKICTFCLNHTILFIDSLQF